MALPINSKLKHRRGLFGFCSRIEDQHGFNAMLVLHSTHLMSLHTHLNPWRFRLTRSLNTGEVRVVSGVGVH